MINQEIPLKFTAEVLRKDLQAYSQALFKQVQYLQLQNQSLEAKVAHLEDLLKAVENVPTIGAK